MMLRYAVARLPHSAMVKEFGKDVDIDEMVNEQATGWGVEPFDPEEERNSWPDHWVTTTMPECPEGCSPLNLDEVDDWVPTTPVPDPGTALETQADTIRATLRQAQYEADVARHVAMSRSVADSEQYGRLTHKLRILLAWATGCTTPERACECLRLTRHEIEREMAAELSYELGDGYIHDTDVIDAED
jgi:hypothetical protein